jgi:iron complex outermembrane receptor protein
MQNPAAHRTAVIVVCVLSPSVHADSDGVPAVANDSVQLDEVQVTAQRRSENLQDVPVSVTALSAAELKNSGVTDTNSLSLAVPGLSYTLGGNGATPFIRGVGSSVNSVGADASVATYVDGVYISSINAQLLELNNVDHIEVLKGPQGTLFGRNATGGVIQIVTANPSFTPSVEARVGQGNYDATSGSLYGTMGLSQTVAADLAAYGTNQADGWGTDLATGQPTFTRHDFGGRTKWLWTPDRSTRVLVAADYNRNRNEDGQGFHVVPPGIGVDGVTRYDGFYNNVGDPNDFSDVRQAGLSVTVESEFPTSKVVSISSWRNVNGLVQLDVDGTPLDVVGGTYRQHDRTVTQELRLLSKDGAALPWIAGVYYLKDASGYDPLNLLGEVAAPLEEIQIWSTQASKSYAGFGQVSPTIATDTHLTVGVRYTVDDRAVGGSTVGVGATETSTLAAASQSASWTKLTWRLALDHHFTPLIMGYISDDRGFKSGIYNLVSYAAAPVNPETLDAFQSGLKFESPDHRFRADLAAFFYLYRNMQVQDVVADSVNLVNAAAAQMKGIDVDFAVLPVDGFTLRGGFEAMQGSYTNFKNAPFFNPTLGAAGEPIGGNTQTVGNATGFDTVQTPKETATVSAERRVALPGGSLSLVISNYYNSGFAWDPNNRLRQSSYDVVTASAEWDSPRNAWSVRIWGKNLTGAQYCAYETAGTLLDQCSPEPPRMYGITVTTHQ